MQAAPTATALTLAAVLAAAVPGAAAASTAPLGIARTNGKPLAVHGRTYVWCGGWDDGAKVRTLRIQRGSPLAPPWWSVEVRVSLARRGRRIGFPVLAGRSAAMFVADPRESLEASTDSERTRGSLTILRGVSCAPGSPVRLRVDARLAGEEAGGPAVDVHGTFAGAVGTMRAPGVEP